MIKVSVDFETRGPVDLKKHGSFVYFEHPQTEVLMAAYKINDCPVQMWTFDGREPRDLCLAIEAGATIAAWNASFEALGFDLLADRYGWPRPRLEQYLDTQAAACAMSLPRALGDAAAALGLEVQKDKEGQRLIRKFSLPKRDGTFNDPLAPENAEDWQKFQDYCKRDVEVEEAISRRIVPLSEAEQRLWTLNLKINRRGIRIDRKSAQSAIVIAEKAKSALDREMRVVTGGYVGKCSEPGKLVEWVQRQGVELNSAAKAEITELLEYDDIPANVRAALELRQEAAKTSVSKLNAMLAMSNADGRVRGTSMYHAAGTGRFQSQGVNFGNLPRPRKIYEDAHLDTQRLFENFRREDPDLLKFLYGDDLGRPLHLISDAIRGFIWAAPGHELIQADYSNIEGNVISWSANEVWKLQAIRELIDDPSLPDMYRRTAAAILGLTTDEVTKKHWARQAVGKPAELACFGRDTKVLTNNGIKSIVAVLPTDLLWDGVEWVCHGGVVAKGARPVVVVDGIEVTPDHLILTGQNWTPARKLATRKSTLRQALATGSASLQSLAARTALPGGCDTSRFSALAVRSLTMSSLAICAAGNLRAARSALAQRLAYLGKIIGATTTSFLTTSTERGCSIAYRPASQDARTQKPLTTQTMAGAAFVFIGAATGGLSYPTLSACRGGTNPLSNWTALTLTEAMSQATSALLRVAKTLRIKDGPVPCRGVSYRWSGKSSTSVNVFDIVNAGPRNRFTIFSDSGALVVHNCSYGGGVPAFAMFARNGGVSLEKIAPAIMAEADEERLEKARKRYEGQAKRGLSGTKDLSQDAWVACEVIKLGWRAQNSAIAQSWRDLETAVREAVENPGTITEAAKVRYIVAKGFLWAQLPSGRCLAYGAPRLKAQVWAKVRLPDGTWSDSEVMERDAAEAGERRGTVKIEGNTSDKVTALGVNSVTRKWERSGLYGGLLAENNTQGIARDVLVNGMEKAESAGYPIIATVYDEIIAEVPRGYGYLAAFENLICELPAWAEGLPLTAGGWRGKRYRKD
ncbi:MAG: hypothetical protein ACOVN5_06990 [Aquidulcibacter sp.]